MIIIVFVYFFKYLYSIFPVAKLSHLSESAFDLASHADVLRGSSRVPASRKTLVGRNA